jgi:hypothetical protein
MDEAFANCADAPKEHDAAKPGRRCNFSDDDVGGDFEEDVSTAISDLRSEVSKRPTHGMKKINNAIL